jgi:hypothetical protein
MAEINLDIGHALSREDQRQNRRNPVLCRSLLPLMSFSGNRAAKFSKKIKKAGGNKELALFSRQALEVRARVLAPFLENAASIESDAGTRRTPKALRAKNREAEPLTAERVQRVGGSARRRTNRPQQQPLVRIASRHPATSGRSRID